MEAFRAGLEQQPNEALAGSCSLDRVGTLRLSGQHIVHALYMEHRLRTLGELKLVETRHGTDMLLDSITNTETLVHIGAWACTGIPNNFGKTMKYIYHI